MHAVIVAAGRGRRLGDRTGDLPKLFLEVGGRTLYERHLASLARVCEEVVVVLGYGFVRDGGSGSDAAGDGGADADRPVATTTSAGASFDGEIHVVETDRADVTVDRARVRRLLATDEDVRVSAVVVPHWASVENAASCRHGLDRVEGDALVVNGDVVYTDGALDRVLSAYRGGVRDDGLSLVAVREGLQDEMTAVRWDEDGRITDYGAIEGHQVAGLFVVNARHLHRARQVLAAREDRWFPVVFTAVPSTYVAVPPDEQFEINTPAHLAAAERALAGEWPVTG